MNINFNASQLCELAEKFRVQLISTVYYCIEAYIVEKMTS